MYRRRLPLFAALFIGALITLSWWQLQSGSDSLYPVITRTGNSAGDSTPNPSGSDANVETVTIRASLADGDRRVAELSNLRLSILTPEGVHVPGALVTITGVNAAAEWRELGLAARCSSSPHVFSKPTGLDGTVELPTLPHSEVPDRLFVWVTHPNHQAVWLDYKDVVDSPLSQLEVQLGRQAGITATVSRRDGSPAPSATIIQCLTGEHSLLDASPRAQGGRESEDLARTALVRLTRTDSQGYASLPQFAYESSAQAVLASEISALRTVVPTRTHMQMQLGATFFLGGSAPCLSNDSDGWGLLAVTCKVGAGTEVLAEFHLRAEAQFGPFEIPLPSEVDAVHATFSSSCGATEVCDLTGVGPGETKWIEFDATPTPESWYRVTDSAGTPLAGAVLKASWNSEGSWVRAQGFTDADGYCELSGLAVDSVSIRVESDGYATVADLEFPAHLPRNEAPVIELHPGRQLRGRVLLDDRPLGRFTIFAWSSDPSSCQVFGFLDRSDGSFELPGLGTEELHLFAASATASSSDTLTVPAGSQDVTGIRLLCRPTGTLAVEVVDSSTGLPVEGARISQLPHLRGIGLQSVAPILLSDARGRARFEEFSCSETVLSVTHPDYSERNVLLPSSSPDTERPSLRIAIHRTKELRIVLHPWPQEQWDTAWVRLRGTKETSYEEVSADGVMVYSEVPVGQIDVLVVFPDSMLITREGHVLPGSDETIIVDLNLDHQLEVVFEDRDEFGDQRIICEYIAKREGEPPFSLRAVLVEDGAAHLRGIPDGIGLIRLSLDDETEVAEQVVTQSMLEDGHLTLRRQTHAIEVEVRSANGDTAEGIYAYAVADHAPMELSDWSVTGPDGSASIARSGSTPSRVFAAIGSTLTSVRRYDPAVHSDEVVELRLIDPVDVHYSAPGAGSSEVELQCNLFLADPRLWVAEISTMVPHSISPGIYALMLKTPGLWLDEDRIEVPPAGGVVEIKVRRLGVLTVKGVSGNAVALDEVELIDALDGESSVERLERGAISRVAVEGGFEFRGLPCGEYQWSARFADGLVREGHVQVPPDARSMLEVARE